MIQSVKSFLLSAIVSTSPQWSETPKAPTAPTEIKTELMTFQPEKQKIYERLSLKQVLKDPNNRISNEFDIPRNIYWRVTFWYEIYTRYNSKVKLVHHKKYPWIVYHKIDTNPIFEKKGRYYNKVYKAKKFERHERWKIQKALTKLSKRKNYRKLTRLERKIFRLLKQVPGSRKKVIREALVSLRVQTGQKDHFVAGLKRRSRYLPAIHERLSLESLPKELAHLPLVESSFNTKATSKVGAAGVWQIMPHIGRQFFTVSKHLDERLSPLKATRVATALLKENYQILNKNWSLAVTAYNHGPSHVRRIFKKTGSHSLGQMILKNKNPRFGFASENFYAEFLAATYASEYQNEVFDSFEKPASLAFDIYQLPPGVQLTASKLLHLTGLSSKEFIEFNFDLKKALSSKHFLPKNFRFYLPEGKAIKFGHNLARWMKKTSLPPKLLSLLESNRRFSIQI